MRGWRRLLDDEGGATALEYGIIVALIVIALMSGLSLFANKSVGLIQTVNGAVSNNM